ncbi:alpha/beta hydrolase [Cellulomonas bogoriensis]|uniref:alpha/beta hydrolase n=1 Tax=Cellulomonas bogoriensis TaxID=301388 RepID=UPI0005587F37|nr:alpha/beta hydrolase [Cellulomonas bogoriensis]
MSGAWCEDVLGPDWEARTLPLRQDEQGQAVATLVRRRRTTARPRRAVLYVHGFVDYFFHTHVADAWDDLGYDLHALDLRTYGRSMLPHQIPDYVRHLGVHTEELDLAARTLREDGYEVVVGYGHSTGGLILPLWVDARRGHPGPPAVDALVLNSPWFELARGPVVRALIDAALPTVAALTPRLPVGGIPPWYGQVLHRDTGGEWAFDTRWKPVDGFPARAAWMRSVRRAHRAVARGLEVGVPVLVCTAARSGPVDRWHEDLDRTDSVLDVQQMVQRAPRLGADVTVVQIPDAVHDLALSARPARESYLQAVRTWVTDRLP